MSHLTSSSWSPTRPGVFFTSDMDGHLNVWDLMTRHSSPTLRVRVSDHPLRCMSVQSKGQMIAAGAANGEITLLRLSQSLYEVLIRNEHFVGAINLMFERCNETKKRERGPFSSAKQSAKKFWTRGNGNWNWKRDRGREKETGREMKKRKKVRHTYIIIRFVAYLCIKLYYTLRAFQANF